jgi:hypothetical protein
MKKSFILLLLIFTAFCVQAYAQTCSPAPVGLVSWWSGDNNALDSRSHNNGTLQNGATFSSGNIGQAVSFDGVDDRVYVPHNSSLNVSNITAEAWVFPTAFVGEGSIINKRTSINNAGYGLEPTAGGNLSFFIYIGGNLFFINSTSQLPLNTWSHVAGTFDGSTMKIFINGVQVGSLSASGSIDATTGDLVIGENIVNGTNWAGKIDEPTVYNRALSVSEIQAIYNAGIAGKCKPSATVAPSGLVGFWSGDGNADDFTGTSNGTLQNGAGFAVGKVGQTFSFDGVDDSVSVGNPASLQTQNFTIEAWIKRASSSIISNNSSFSGNIFAYGQDGYAIGIFQSTNRLFLSKAGVSGISSNISITDTNYHHVVVTQSAGITTFYVDGVADTPMSYNPGFAFTSTASIGTALISGGNGNFFGNIDEVSVYNRGLTADEVTSIYNAGIAGKLKDNSTPTGSSVVVNTKSDATVTFPNVTTAGITQQIPLDLSLFPTLPSGSTTTGLTYDIDTSAAFTGSPQVCFNLPLVTNSSNFNNLRIYHLESNVWQNRTDLSSINFATKTICTSGLTSLSPFAVVSASPTASSSYISGKVLTDKGRGILRAKVTLLNTNTGETKQVITNNFGKFNFEDLPSGDFYILSVSKKGYQFEQRTFQLNEDLDGLNIIGTPY